MLSSTLEGTSGRRNSATCCATLIDRCSDPHPQHHVSAGIGLDHQLGSQPVGHQSGVKFIDTGDIPARRFDGSYPSSAEWQSIGHWSAGPMARAPPPIRLAHRSSLRDLQRLIGVGVALGSIASVQFHQPLQLFPTQTGHDDRIFAFTEKQKCLDRQRLRIRRVLVKDSLGRRRASRLSPQAGATDQATATVQNDTIQVLGEVLVGCRGR